MIIFAKTEGSETIRSLSWERLSVCGTGLRRSSPRLRLIFTCIPTTIVIIKPVTETKPKRASTEWSNQGSNSQRRMPGPVHLSLLLDPIEYTPEVQDPRASSAGSIVSTAMIAPGAIKPCECHGMSTGVMGNWDKAVAVAASRYSLLWTPTGKVPINTTHSNLLQSISPTISIAPKAPAAAAAYRHTTAGETATLHHSKVAVPDVMAEQQPPPAAEASVSTPPLLPVADRCYPLELPSPTKVAPGVMAGRDVRSTCGCLYHLPASVNSTHSAHHLGHYIEPAGRQGSNSSNSSVAFCSQGNTRKINANSTIKSTIKKNESSMLPFHMLPFEVREHLLMQNSNSSLSSREGIVVEGGHDDEEAEWFPLLPPAMAAKQAFTTPSKPPVTNEVAKNGSQAATTSTRESVRTQDGAMPRQWQASSEVHRESYGGTQSWDISEEG